MSWMGTWPWALKSWLVVCPASASKQRKTKSCMGQSMDVCGWEHGPFVPLCRTQWPWFCDDRHYYEDVFQALVVGCLLWRCCSKWRFLMQNVCGSWAVRTEKEKKKGVVEGGGGDKSLKTFCHSENLSKELLSFGHFHPPTHLTKSDWLAWFGSHTEITMFHLLW